MPRKHFRKFLPDHAQVRDHPLLRRFKPLLGHPNLWHLNRHSVAGGVAVGLFAGLVPGPLQMGSAAILAILFRVNLPIAMLTTLYTNPLTWGPLIIAAYTIGGWFTGERLSAIQIPSFSPGLDGWHETVSRLWTWLLGLGETYLIGSALLGLGLALLGYVLVQAGWRLYVLAYLRRRQRRAQARR